MNNTPLLYQLLLRGDEISVQNGRLIISPRSGNSVPDEWFKSNRIELFTQIAELTQQEMFIFDRHTTGNYGAKKYSGVTLHFINILTGENAYCVFNADLTYKKTTKKHVKGSPLPKKRFGVNRHYRLYKFYKSTGLAMPRRQSCFHEVINKLKNVVFCGETNGAGKFTNKLLPLADISFVQINNAFRDKYANNVSTNTQQRVNKVPTENVNIDSNVTHGNKGLQQDRSTCTGKYDISLQESTNKGLTITATSNTTSTTLALSSTSEYQRKSPLSPLGSESRRVQDQSNEGWLKDTGY